MAAVPVGASRAVVVGGFAAARRDPARCACRGLLLAVSTLAFAIAAQSVPLRPPDLHRRQHGTIASRSTGTVLGLDGSRPQPRVLLLRASSCSWSCSSSWRPCAAPGIGRSIDRRARERATRASALTVSPTRAKLTRVRGLGRVHRRPRRCAARRPSVTDRPDGALLHASTTRCALVAIAVIGGLGSLAGAGHRRAVGRRPARVLARQRRSVPLFTSSIGLADHPAVLPRRLHADRLLRSRDA